MEGMRAREKPANFARVRPSGSSLFPLSDEFPSWTSRVRSSSPAPTIMFRESVACGDRLPLPRVLDASGAAIFLAFSGKICGNGNGEREHLLRIRYAQASKKPTILLAEILVWLPVKPGCLSDIGVCVAFYKLKSKYGALEVSEARQLRALEDDNRGLKLLPRESLLDNAALKDLLRKKTAEACRVRTRGEQNAPAERPLNRPRTLTLPDSRTLSYLGRRGPLRLFNLRRLPLSTVSKMTTVTMSSRSIG